MNSKPTDVIRDIVMVVGIAIIDLVIDHIGMTVAVADIGGERPRCCP